MTASTNYLTILEACGGRQTELDRRDRQSREQRWRRVFAARLHAATGKWKWEEFDWHIFSYHHAKSISGHEAMAEYLRLDSPALLVIPEGYSCPSLSAFQLSAAMLPNFEGSGLDVNVWPEDLTWTMAFTHEEGWCGPYFSRREWLEGQVP